VDPPSSKAQAQSEIRAGGGAAARSPLKRTTRGEYRERTFVFGAVANAKYYERWFRHWVRAYAYREQLVQRYPEIEVHLESFSRKPTHDRTYVYESEIDQKYRRSRLHKLPLNRLWVGLNLIVAVGGTVLTVIILTQN
jgi:hypothetical protein